MNAEQIATIIPVSSELLEDFEPIIEVVRAYTERSHRRTLTQIIFDENWWDPATELARLERVHHRWDPRYSELDDEEDDW